MVKRKHRYLSLLTVLIMLMSLLSGFTVQAEGDPEEQQLAGGLALGWVQFDEGTETHLIDPSNMGDGMWFDAKTIGVFAIGWRHADGTLTAFTDADWEYLAFTDQEDQPVDVDIQPLMEGYLDEVTDQWEERRAGDGMYTAYFQSPGEYKLTYTGALTEETFPEGKEPFTVAGISVSMPLVAAYSDAEATEETLLGSQIHYGTDYFFYVIAGSTVDEQHRTTASIAEINFFDERVRDLVEVEEIEAGKSYKLTVSEMQDYPFNFQAVVDFAEYDYNGTQFELVDERREDRWFDCYTPERYGFAADWTQFEQDEPVFDGDRLGSALYDYEIMADNTFTFGWKGLNGEVTPVPLEDLDKISIYDEYGEVPEDAYISAATRWDDQQQDEVPLGDGFFNMWIGTPGIYTITYDSGEELTPPDGAIISESITLYAVMPHVSLFSTDEYSLDTLIGPRADYTEDQREFYINKNDDVADDWKRLYTITDLELQGASDVADYVTYEEAGESYKVSIADNYTEHFNIRVIYTTTEYRYEDEDWQLSNEWDRDYWIDFDYWEPTPFGFMIGWPYFDPADPDAPPVYPDVLFYGMGAEAKTLATIALGWMDAEGNVTPIPQTDIDKLHLFDPDGNEVISEWISIPYRWDEEAQEDVPLNIDGIFDVNFPGTGVYIMTLDKDITGIEVPEGMAVETAFPMNIEYPTIGIYDSTEVSDDSLLGKNVSFTDGNELVYYIQVTDHIDSQNRMERSITDYQIEAPEGFEDVADELATIEEISDHILKVTIAEDCYVGFDVTVTAITTNQHFDWQTQTWEYDDETWLDVDRLGFWFYEKERYGFVMGWPNPQTLMADEDMHDHLDGVFARSGISVIFGWRNADGELEQIIDEDEIADLIITREGDEEAPQFSMERQDNDGNIYDMIFDRPGLYTIKYTGELAVDEEIEDKIFSDEVTVWVDLPFIAAYSSDEASMDTLLDEEVIYTPDTMVCYINGMYVRDEHGFMESEIESVKVKDNANPDFVTFEEVEGGIKVTITKEPNKDYDGIFTLEAQAVLTTVFFNDQGEEDARLSETKFATIDFLPGEGFEKGSVSVNLTADGAVPEGTVIFLENTDTETYYGLDGSVIENMENIWIPITPGTPVVFENIPVGTYVIGEDSAAAAVSGYKLDETNSVLESGEFLIVEDVISAVELKNVYLKVYPYRNEWRGNRWYNADGTQTYAPLGSWKHNAKGYWFGDSSGWYAKNCWQKIDGKSYYFAADGYMAANCYRGGYYLTKNGAYDGKGKATWQHNSKGWWYKLPDGTYLKNTWAVIDGKWYYFKANGYAAANEWVKGYYWINANMTWTYKPKGSWHKTASGWWFGDSSGWYAKNATYVIDGKSYTFNAYGYWKQK